MRILLQRSTVIIVLGLVWIPTLLLGQTNAFPSSGDAEIKSGQLLLETNSWREALLTFKDTHYAPYQVFKMQIESDGLKIRQDASVNYQFKSGGDFIVNNGKVGIGTYTPGNRLEVFGSSFNRISALVNADVQNGFQIKRTGTNETDWEIYNPAASTDLRLYNAGVGDILTLKNNGNVGINTNSAQGKLHINTNVWAASLLTFSDTHYPYPIDYHFQIESDGLKIKQGSNVNYQFKFGGDFIVNNGAVRSKEVNVSLTPGSGPDYVFERDYDLLPLSEVETYINKYKHLPEVPSAKQMEEEGLNLKEMNLILLKKIEELTLHLIQQQKEIESLKSQIK